MMDEKQIEEMAKIVLQEPHVGGLYGFDKRIASRLYDTGYRKSTDLAEEIFADEISFAGGKESSTEAKSEPNTYVPSAYAQNSQNFESIPDDGTLPF